MASNKVTQDSFSDDPENQFGNQVAHGFEIDDEITSNTNKYHTNFMGCCCDFRRAVIVVNGITLVLQILTMVGVAFLPKYLENNLDDIEANIADDAARDQVDTFAKGGDLTSLVIIVEVVEIIGLFFSVIGIYGALKFKRWAITTALCFYSIRMLLQLISIRSFGGVFVLFVFGLWVYPHVYMLSLMRAGIMTESNYPNIAKCCGKR